MSYKSDKALRLATGITLLLKTNATPAIMVMKMNSGSIKRINDMPEDFIATSSKFSPISPKVIMEASNMLSGRASGTRVVDM